MTKEFNLANYQYTEEHITFDEFLKYVPRPNHLDGSASFNGTLYQHAGDQWQHIMQLPSSNVWTLYTDEHGAFKIRNGYQVNGRLGYFHTDHMHNAHTTIIVDGLDINSF